MKTLKCKAIAFHPLIVSEQSRNLVCKLLKKVFFTCKKLFLKTMSDGLILVSQDGAFFEILQLDHSSN